MFFSSWKRRKAGRCASKKHRHKAQMAGLDVEVTIPNEFRCPVSRELMKDPVTLSTGITYDRHCIEKWIEAGNVTCPVTNQVLSSLEALPNHHLRKMIQDWCVEHRSHGIERIPTPRAPLSSAQVSEMLSELLVAARQDGSEDKCVTLVVKMKALVRENERNRRLMVSGGAVNAMSAAFEAFSKASANENAAVLREILSTLTLMFPLDGEAMSCLASASSFHCLLWLLRCGDLLERSNAVLVLKEVLSKLDACDLADNQVGEAMEALVGLIKDPICPKATKASLMAIYCMVSSSPLSSTSLANEEAKARFVKMGLVALLLEMLVDSEKGLCEKALGVLDALCSCKEGRQKACDHALTVPLLVKKLLRVSDLATEFSVSILWKLMDGTSEETDVHVAVEALGVGAFQKLLLLLQVGCCERTKEEATELLKVLNLRRDRLECIDSLDFKDLKRPF